jgi:hypothetical protein
MGFRWFLFTKSTDVAGSAGRIALIPTRSYRVKDFVDRILERIVSKRCTVLILQGTGAKFAPGIDVDGVGGAPTSEQTV